MPERGNKRAEATFGGAQALTFTHFFKAQVVTECAFAATLTNPSLSHTFYFSIPDSNKSLRVV